MNDNTLIFKTARITVGDVKKVCETTRGYENVARKLGIDTSWMFRVLKKYNLLHLVKPQPRKPPNHRRFYCAECGNMRDPAAMGDTFVNEKVICKFCEGNE